MKKIRYDILVIGGGPAGMITATAAKAYHGSKSIAVIRKNKDAQVPCAIPYVVGGRLESNQNLIPPQMVTKEGVELIFDEVVEVDFYKKEAKSINGTIYEYDKLVFATGSLPNVPPMEGVDAKGVFTVKKDRESIEALKEKIKDSKKIVIVGTGFIGVELAMEFANKDKEITLIGREPGILRQAFDDEFAKEGEDIIIKNGIDLRNSCNTKRILTDENYNAVGVELESGEKIYSDVVILAVGYHPNVALAKKAGLRIGKKGGIWVDEYMRTEAEDVFAVGDCASKQHFLTRKTIGLMLASTSTAEARVAAISLYKIEYIKGFSGTISIFSTVIGDRAFASAGVTENEALKENIDIVTATFEGIDKHPGTLKDTHKQVVKLIATRHNGTIIGGQISGGESIGEMINTLGLIIENRMSVSSLIGLQIATHPLLTAPPTAYPIIKAAEMIEHKLYGNGITTSLKEKKEEVLAAV